MLFEGEELREIIGRSSTEIELRNAHGRCCRILSSADALALDLDLFVGIGNRRRIRFRSRLHPGRNQHTHEQTEEMMSHLRAAVVPSQLPDNGTNRRTQRFKQMV